MDTSWRLIILDLKSKVRRTRDQGHTQIDLSLLENELDALEDVYQELYDKEILENINNPHANFNKAFSDGIDKYAKAMVDIAHQNKAYTQVVISAGYLTFFALWAVTRETHYSVIHTLAALCLGISAAIFVIFEVLKMMLEGFRVNFQCKVLIKAREADDMHNRSNEMNKISSHDDWLKLIHVRLWIAALIPSVLFGLIGIGLLFSCFVISLYTEIAPQTWWKS
ncbi:MAG: hypothetical protein CVU35_05105 [Betaproteobacteria bacterium HGW-Betaproteobacteria-8]|nr:MAG: hypothetical protein CVU35_05105 [Betaproteobacteria bacterium HGW-Betaproteobacteria-8]